MKKREISISELKPGFTMYFISHACNWYADEVKFIKDSKNCYCALEPVALEPAFREFPQDEMMKKASSLEELVLRMAIAKPDAMMLCAYKRRRELPLVEYTDVIWKNLMQGNEYVLYEIMT